VDPLTSLHFSLAAYGRGLQQNQERIFKPIFGLYGIFIYICTLQKNWKVKNDTHHRKR
jgi:hypothetical protein